MLRIRDVLVAGCLISSVAGAIEVVIERPDAKSMASWNEPDPFLTISTRFKRNSGLTDFRTPRLASGFVSIPTEKPTVGTLSLARTDFTFSAAVFQVPEASARLNFLLPINSVTSSQANVPSGSEFGGLGIGMSGDYGKIVSYDFSYADRKSTKLKLHDPHYEIFTGLYLQLNETIEGNIAARALVGPEIALPLQPGTRDAIVDYGLQWGGRARLEAESGKGTPLNFRWVADIMLRRASAYTVAGIEQGGAGLFSVSPSVDYNLLDNAWIGIGAELPIFRPRQREVAFGNIGLPALYGTSFGLRFSAVAL